MKKIIAGLMLICCFLTACDTEQTPEVVTQEVTTVPTTADTLTEEIPTEETQPTTAEPTTQSTEESVAETTVAPTEPLTENETEPITAAPTEPTTSPVTTPPVTEAPTQPPTIQEPTPTETQPPETEPPVTEPEYEVIDTAALEAYGRAYAETLGYAGNPNTGFATNAGYFPPSWMRIRTMEEGYQRVKELVDTQYANDVAAGHAIFIVIDGVERHRKLNIYLEPTDDPNMFLMYCFYGGE